MGTHNVSVASASEPCRPEEHVCIIGAKAYKTAFKTLVESKYLAACSDRSHISPRDRLIQYEAQVKRERLNEGGSSLLSPKDLMEIKMTAMERIQREQGETEATAMVSLALLAYAAEPDRSECLWNMIDYGTAARGD